jgi:hypothetical protein
LTVTSSVTRPRYCQLSEKEKMPVPLRELADSAWQMNSSVFTCAVSIHAREELAPRVAPAPAPVVAAARFVAVAARR